MTRRLLLAPALVLFLAAPASSHRLAGDVVPAGTAPDNYEPAANVVEASIRVTQDPTDGADSVPELGSVIVVHPDGAGVNHWGAARLLAVGPDGELAWDRVERIGVYRGHLSTSLASSSHGGATAHAYGVKVPFDSYGMRGTEPLTALSGEPYSVLQEAQRAGLSTALVNSGHIAEPGTGVFGASAVSRAETDQITRALIESGIDVILGGGEVLLLPPDQNGRFGYAGMRRDGLDMIQRAKALGYTVVYTRDELLRLPDTTPKVLGIFAAGHTFNARPEEALEALQLPNYWPEAPTIAEMTAKTLSILAAKGERFLLISEEEGSDNFSGANNANGALEALRRADAALAAALDFVDRNPRTLLLTMADSDAGGLQVQAVRDSAEFDLPLPARAQNGAPLDGPTGTESVPFTAQPDAAGAQLRFGVAWASTDDLMGGIVARAHGLNADWLPASVDNTDIYRMLYATLFGTWLP